MSNSALKVGRRHFLTGLGGFALAIPFLPSLEKRASATGTTATPRFFYLGTDHGGCWDTNFFPTVSMTQSTTVVPGHTVTAGTLSASVTNGNAVLSPVLTASSTSFTPSLIGKMNVLRGLDLPWYIAHNTGLHLGNFARNDGSGSTGTDGGNVGAMGARPTIDQIMAISPEFYSSSDLASTTLKTMVINSGRQLSYQFLDPTQGVAGGVQNYQGLDSSLQLFNAVFGGFSSGPAMRPPVVDRVLANYNSLLQGNTRLSALDRQRLQAHIQQLSQLQASLSAQISCTAPMTPMTDAQSLQTNASGGTSVQAGQLWLDIVAAAFACNASRIGVYGFGETSNLAGGAAGPYTGMDWHHDVAHQWGLDQPQTWLSTSYQQVFEQFMVYLASKLDQIQDGNGQTVLDNSLLVWSQECCMETHMTYGLQTVTFGGAAGKMNTGLLCDYRNLSQSGTMISPATDAGSPTTVSTNPAFTGYTTAPGLLWEQWLATELQMMGIPPSEFELWTDASGNPQHGYGTPYVDPNFFCGGWTPFGTHYGNTSSQYFAMASDILPFLARM